MAQVKDRMIGSDHLTSGEIRNNIRRTRTDIDTTTGAIEQKLTPGELVYEAWSFFRGGSSSSVNRVLRIAKDYPMPSAIISLGVGWMMYEGGRGNQNGTHGHRPTRYADEPSVLESARQSAAGLAGRAVGAAGAAVDTVKDFADHTVTAAGDVATSVQRQATEVGRQAAELGDQALSGVREARTDFWETFESQPLVMGAATLAAGVLVGLLLPSTPQENQLMGGARESLMEALKGLGLETLEKSKQMATAAAETLTQGAEAEGLSVDAVADKVRAFGSVVMETVKAEAEKQNLMPDTSSAEPREANVDMASRQRAA